MNGLTTRESHELRAYRRLAAHAGNRGSARDVAAVFCRIGEVRACGSRELALRMLLAWTRVPCSALGERLSMAGLERLAIDWSWADVVDVCAAALATRRRSNGATSAALAEFAVRMLHDGVVGRCPDVARAMPDERCPTRGRVFRAVARRCACELGDVHGARWLADAIRRQRERPTSSPRERWACRAWDRAAMSYAAKSSVVWCDADGMR